MNSQPEFVAVTSKRPILVTGSFRSGSTWVGQMIANNSRVLYITEPFNSAIPSYPLCDALNTSRPRFPVSHMYHCVTEKDEAQFIAYMTRVLEVGHSWWSDVSEKIVPRRFVGATLRSLRWWVHRARGFRPLLKDPIAFFSAEWLATTFDMDVVVLIRHPAAFASSLKRLNWYFPFTDLLCQPRLMQTYLQPFEQEITRLNQSPHDIIDEATLLWRVFHSVILRYQRSHPNWIFVRHEDLSLSPHDEFEKLLRRLGLTFTRAVRRAIEAHTSEENPSEACDYVIHQLRRNSKANIWNWKNRLTAQEIARIRAGTADVAGFFYSERDWQRPTTAAVAA